ncbi:hypothetical protein GGX14DRAFT_398064 [Mycena pura]|uniref:Uncharacterized protein n=1 Tax=Mycena pura TaxID=153505 RepID=A0AAD6Y9Z2_9AGAR|nr:hypothetical protein GGX14DRAFT_398064 [Mycena pura]
MNTRKQLKGLVSLPQETPSSRPPLRSLLTTATNTMDSPNDHYAPSSYQQSEVVLVPRHCDLILIFLQNQENQWNSRRPLAAVQHYPQQSDMSLSHQEADVEKYAAGPVCTDTDRKETWHKWFPERSTGLVAWFTFFSLGSAALTLTALFGCYSMATSNLHIIGMEPYTIYDACLASLFARNSSMVNETSLPSSEFFRNPLPWKYEVGITGVCRVFNSTDVSSPSVTFQTECKRQLHPPLDLLHLIAQDLPNGTAGSQYQNWENLLNKAVPGFQDKTSKVSTRAHLLVASSALLILSIIWTFTLIVATIFIDRMYPHCTVVLDILDALLVLGAAAMWTAVAGPVQDAYTFNGQAGIPQGVNIGPAFWVLWAIGFAKLVVTPMMMIALIRVIIWATVLTIQFAALCCCTMIECMVAMSERHKTVVYVY